MEPITELLPNLRLRRDSSDALHRQIYARIRDDVLRGSLSPGMALPSSRALATHHLVTASRAAIVTCDRH